MAKKKKTRKKKVSKRATPAKRKSRLSLKEREKLKSVLSKYYGPIKFEKMIKGAKNIKELEVLFKQFKRQMDEELERDKRECEEYFNKIDAEWKKIGRPRSMFNDKELKYLCSILCTQDEIAGFFQMSKPTLVKRVREEYDMSWSEFYERNSQGAKVSLRRRQIQAAMDGSDQMLKFLGKNMLGQKEKVDFDGEVKVNSWVDLVTNLKDEDNEKKK